MASDVIKDQERGKTSESRENVPPGSSTVPVKRLTKVEKARLEALSAFGNCPFNSLVVKKESFKSKLKATALITAPKKETVKRLTRMQKARQEANEAFKNISLGQKRKYGAVEKKPGMSPVSDNAKKRMTRLERCKLETQNAFANVALSELTAGENAEQKRSFGKASLTKINKECRKSTTKGRQSRRSLTRRKSVRRKSSAKCNRPTRVQLAQLQALESFGGKSLDKVWMTSEKEGDNTVPKEATDAAKEPADTNDSNDSNKIAVNDGSLTMVGGESVPERNIQTNLTEVDVVLHNAQESLPERSGLPVVAIEDLSEISATQLSCNDCCQQGDLSGNLCESEDSKLHAEGPELNTVNIKVVQDQDGKIVDDQCNDDYTKRKSAISRENLCELQTGNAQLPETKPMTRLERARMEALQSFQGQAIDQVMKSSSRKMAKYLTPVKHKGTNTEATVSQTKNTPSQTTDSFIRSYPLPKKSYYSNIRDNSFCNRDALLETSKIVVSTARSLDTPTPDSSPAQIS